MVTTVTQHRQVRCGAPAQRRSPTLRSALPAIGLIALWTGLLLALAGPALAAPAPAPTSLAPDRSRVFTPPASPGGTTDKVTIADASSIDLPGSFTIEAWVEPTTVDAEGTILEKRQSYALAIRNGGLLQYQLDSVLSGTRGIWFDTGLTIQPGRWTHVALVKDGTDVRVYLNGTLEYSRSAQALDEFGVLYAIPPTISVTA
ncbi:MAG: LamG domain-containing protein, partial [Actinomycetota bacterium]